MRSELIAPLVELAGAWRATTRSSHRRASAAAVALVGVLALLLARRGTPQSRTTAAVAIALSLVLVLVWGRLRQRREAHPENVLMGPGRAVDRERVDRALRALSLLQPQAAGRTDGTSPDLVHVHVERALGQVPAERIVERASRVAARVSGAALVIAVSALGVALANAWSVLEGADVLVARRGVAPVSMQWLDDIQLVARPPDYLHDSEIREPGFSALALPYGTIVTVHGSPLHAGRRLLLSDGMTEVPFVEDGASALVARWSLTQTGTLRVVARFGDVDIPESAMLPIASIPDAAPVVELEGAPRRLLLAEQTEDVAIKYEASDDHGLREVDLVLRSGTREERRLLARLDGETTSDKGGHTLRLRDPFLKKSHVPVEVTVEARGNDPLTGPKWGASAAITIVPPEVGEPEAQRLEALRKLRDSLVDDLAVRLQTDVPTDRAPRSALIADDLARTETAGRLLDSTVSGVYAGIRVPASIRAILMAQQQAARKAVDAQARALSPATRATVVKSSERYVLVTDSVVRGLGLRDARESARQLADVADDLAAGAGQMQGEALEARARGAARLEAAGLVLAGGGRTMRRLGALGRDLGEIIDADLSRVQRARQSGDLFHAELAARDLATRLREPDFSFGARGGSMGHAGGESGGDPGQGEAQPPDDVEQAFQQAAQDLERLSRDHASQVAKTEEELNGSSTDEEQGKLRDEAREHAEEVRKAVRPLPAVGRGSESWTSKGAAAREFAEQMAHSLEQGRPEEAVESGRSALGLLEGAKEMLRKGRWADLSAGDVAKVDDAHRKLEAEQKWAESRLRQMRQQAAQRARKQLEQGGEDEDRLADRARELGQKAQGRGAFPQQALESIEGAERAARQAAQALKDGDPERGLDQQREAQRRLEAAQEQLQGSDDEAGTSPEGDSREGDGRQLSREKVDLKHEFKGPEEFRRRVMRGLGQPAGGALKDAVQRYAEGLLR